MWEAGGDLSNASVTGVWMTASREAHRNHGESAVGRPEEASGRKLARAPGLGGVAGEDASAK